MAGLDLAIQAKTLQAAPERRFNPYFEDTTWMAGSSPAMTKRRGEVLFFSGYEHFLKLWINT
jgi:hypothetical protein